MDVHRIGFTQLLHSNNASDEGRRINIILVHGLRGHPRHTWESSRKVPSTHRGSDTKASSKRKYFKSLLKPRPSGSSTADQDTSEACAVFWPQDYLIEDIPEARVWTYGYNAEVIGGLFQSNNQNSVSQHGRDLAVKAEREVENEVDYTTVSIQDVKKY
ncbi:hypothetical protein ACMFMF_000830 [Clarireedia jacksonii]